MSGNNKDNQARFPPPHLGRPEQEREKESNVQKRTERGPPGVLPSGFKAPPCLPDELVIVYQLGDKNQSVHCPIDVPQIGGTEQGIGITPVVGISLRGR